MKRADPHVKIAYNLIKLMTTYIYGDILIKLSDVRSIYFSQLTISYS
jgi:hypothetical protein